MTELIIRMLRVFFHQISVLFFSTNFVMSHGGGFINFLFVVFGTSIFVYILLRLIRGYS